MRSVAAFAPAMERLPAPAAEAGEATIEAGREVDPVAGPLGAEIAARGDPVISRRAGVDVDLGEIVGPGAAAGIDEDAGVAAAREGEAAEPGAGRRRQLGADRVGLGRIEADLVVAGPGPLAGVDETGPEAGVEARGAVRGRRAGDRLGGRDEGEIAVESAAGAAEMGEAEPLEVVVAIVIAPGVAVRGRGVGAPLNHAEGSRRPGEIVASAEGARSGTGAGEGHDVAARGAGGEAGGARRAREAPSQEGMCRASHSGAP